MSGDLFWELHQHRRIYDAQTEAAGARSRATQVSHEIDDLRMKVDRLSLACQAMWELLRDDGAFEEERLLGKIQEVDLRDGRADGKIGASPIACPDCGRMANSRRRACMYCGASLRDGQKHVFE